MIASEDKQINPEFLENESSDRSTAPVPDKYRDKAH
jgi:hypothetical protein